MGSGKQRSSLHVAAIGNGRVAALVDQGGRIVWWCFPRLDGDPIFSRLLAGDEEKGFCDIVLDGQVSATSSYVRNTGIVETILVASNGASVKVTDFAPRFPRYGRSFHPAQLVRRIEPLAGLPRIVCRFRPTFDYGSKCANVSQGSNHIRYLCGSNPIRVTTDMAVSYILHETPFALTRPVTLIMGGDEPVESSVDAMSREFLERTREYWVNVGSRTCRQLRVADPTSFAPPFRSSCARSRKPAPSRQPSRHPFQRRQIRPEPGTTATAGCATRIS